MLPFLLGKIMNIKEWAVIGAVILSVFFWQRYEISSLRDNVTTMTQTISSQKTQIENIQSSVDGMKQNDANQSANRQARDKADAKLKRDSAAVDIFAKKPMLLEKQINDSFRKQANEIIGLTK